MSQRDTYIERLEIARAAMREIVKTAQDNPTIYHSLAHERSARPHYRLG